MAVSNGYQSYRPANLPDIDVFKPTGRQSGSGFVPNHLESFEKNRTEITQPDRKPCTETTRGLLGRTRIVARKIIPVGKETDRSWADGGDPRALDRRPHTLREQTKMCVADPSERKRWSKIGVRKLIRSSGFSQTTVYKILQGEPVRCYILSSFRKAVDSTA